MQCAHGRFDFKQKRWWWWSCNPDMKMFWSGRRSHCGLSWGTRDATLSANPTNQPLFKPPKDWRNESNKQYTPIKEATEQNNFSPCSWKMHYIAEFVCDPCVWICGNVTCFQFPWVHFNSLSHIWCKRMTITWAEVSWPMVIPGAAIVCQPSVFLWLVWRLIRPRLTSTHAPTLNRLQAPIWSY